MSNYKSSGIGCLTIIGIIFVTLKLLAIEPVAHWSWLWVLCPFWIGFAISMLAFFIGVVLLALFFGRCK